MYVLIENNQVKKYPYMPYDLVRDNPQTSFPETITDAVMESFGALKVKETNAPEFDDLTQDCVRDGISLENGVWTEVWKITNVSDAVKAERIANKKVSMASNIRDERDQRLANSDWTQLADAPVDRAAWAAYRQALRDLPAQADFPENVSWPTKP